MFYVYLDHYYGKELIGKSEDLAVVEKIKADKDAKRQPGDMWHTRITETEEKEVSYFD